MQMRASLWPRRELCRGVGSSNGPRYSEAAPCDPDKEDTEAAPWDPDKEDVEATPRGPDKEDTKAAPWDPDKEDVETAIFVY